MCAIRDIEHPDGSWRNKYGRPVGSGTAAAKVAAYRAEFPTGKPKECMAVTGLSKNTVYKWWRSNNGE
jgi:hypothetical protein